MQGNLQGSKKPSVGFFSGTNFFAPRQEFVGLSAQSGLNFRNSFLLCHKEEEECIEQQTYSTFYRNPATNKNHRYRPLSRAPLPQN